MPKKIALIDGHPDAAPERFCHALVAAYEDGARKAGHETRRIDVASLSFPLLRSQDEFRNGAPPPDVAAAQETLAWADHWVVVFPLWLGDLPALTRGFFEQASRPGFALRYDSERFPTPLLKGKSARLVATMGMPALIYRIWFLSHGVRAFDRNVLRLSGMGPVRTSIIGGVGGMTPETATGWLDRMRALGRAAA